MALQFSITASGAMVMQAAINLFGSVAVAAFTAASKVQSLVTQGMMSMGQTMASYGGQNYGKGDYHRLEKGVRSALLISVIYSLLAARCSCRRSVPAPAAFPVLLRNIDIASLMPWAKTYIYMCAVFYIPLSTIFIFRNIMQGCGYSFLPMMGGVAELFARMIHSTDRHEACKLSPRLLLRSCCMGRRGALYRIFLVIRQRKSSVLPCCRRIPVLPAKQNDTPFPPTLLKPHPEFLRSSGTYCAAVQSPPDEPSFNSFDIASSRVGCSSCFQST